MFIINATPQDYMLVFVPPGSQSQVKYLIQRGGQLDLSNLSADEKTALIEQNEPYGLVEARKIGRGFCGIAYSDKRVDNDVLLNGAKRKDETIDAVRENAFKVSALVADQTISQTRQDLGLSVESPTETVIEELPNKDNKGEKLRKINIQATEDGR